ncbi:MAG: type II toxin-antitoxin system RelE/ParE family toxin [Pseudomonadota bacterium]
MILSGIPPRKELLFMGNSREVLRGFPKVARKALGDELSTLQMGFIPRHYRPLPSIGPGVYELRHQDERAWYRVAYLMRMKGRIFVLHVFEKETGKTSKRDLRTLALRLKEAMAHTRRERNT